MKKIILIVTMLCSFTVFAKDWNLSFDITMGARSGVWYRAEHKVADNYSLGIGYLRFAEEYYSDFDVNQYLIYGTYWFNSTIEQGWLVSLELSSSEVSYEIEPGDTENVSGFGYGVSGGYQWQWENFNTGILLHVRAYSFDRSIDYNRPGASGNVTVPHHSNGWLGWTLGWAF